MATKSKTSTTTAAVGAAAEGLSQARATLTTYTRALAEARSEKAQLERRLGQGDAEISGADLVRVNSELDRLVLLQQSAKAAVGAAERADNLARTDAYAETFAAILREEFGGHLRVEHLPMGSKVPEVEARTVFVQLSQAQPGKFDLVGGSTTLHAVITTASPGLDDDFRPLLPGFGKGKAYVPPIIGSAGSASQIQWGQRYPKKVVGKSTITYGVAVKAAVATARPLLAHQPASHRFNTLGQQIAGELKRKRDNRAGSGDTAAVELVGSLDNAKHGVKISADNTMVSTFEASIAALTHGDDAAQVAASIRHRLGKLEGRHQPGIGRITTVEFGTPRGTGVKAGGVETGRTALMVPVEITIAAQLAPVVEQDDDED